MVGVAVRRHLQAFVLALVLGCGSAQPAPAGTAVGATPPSLASEPAGAPAPAAAPTGQSATPPAQPSDFPSKPRPARTGDAELDSITDDLANLREARRDCNPAPSREYLAQLEVQQATEIPSKESPVRKSCEKIELPDQSKGPACDEPLFDCYAAVKMLRPETARAFVGCLTPKSKTRAMCGHGPGNCVAQAVNATVPSAQVTAVCARIAKRCRTVARKPLAETTCRKYLTAVDCDEVQTAGSCLANACAMRDCFDPIDEPTRR